MELLHFACLILLMLILPLPTDVSLETADGSE